VLLAIKNGTLFFSPVHGIALGVLAVYTVGGMFMGKATFWEHVSGFVGGVVAGVLFVF
jgi:membrane associated rhomboid family serine protease